MRLYRRLAHRELPADLGVTRTGSSVTGYDSADGTAWRPIGTVPLAGLPETVHVGLFVAAETMEEREAEFDNVTITPGGSGTWQETEVGRPLAPGRFSETGGVFTVAGQGAMWFPPVSPELDHDHVRNMLASVIVGLIAIIALGVLCATTEYGKGLIRTTFTVVPRRGRVLAAKAVVVGIAAFVAGLVASFTTFLLNVGELRAGGIVPANGFVDLPAPSDRPVLRALVGTGLLLAAVALLSLGVGVLLRRPAGAITTVIGLVVMPQFLAWTLPPDQATYVERYTPFAGFAIQQTKAFDGGTPVAIGPWAGFGVLCLYTVLTLAAAYWVLHRRDA